MTIKYFGDGKLKKRALIASILAATLIVGGPSLASAEQVKLTETIEEINQEILLGADLDELTISSDSARTNLSLTLLGADSGAVWEQEGSNQNLAFDNFSLNATSTEPGSAQVLITIAEEASPEDYSFELSLNGQPALAEVLTKLQSTFSLQMRTYISERPQYRDQFDCHAFGAPLGFLLQGVDKSPSWDLEGTRSPNRDVLDWVSSKCNW